MRCLVSLGAPLEARNLFGDTPLLGAARESNPAALEALVAEGADIAAQNRQGSTALHLAAIAPPSAESLTCVRLLLAAGAPVNARTRGDGLTPAMFAADTPVAPATMRELLIVNARSYEVDMSLVSTQVVPETLVSLVLHKPQQRSAVVVRQMVVEEAYRREMQRRGSGDPTNLLGLHNAPRPLAPWRLQSPDALGFGFHLRSSPVPDSDAAVVPVASEHHLPRRGRALRYDNGASVADPSQLVPSEFIAPPRDVALAPLRALLMATHAQLGADSPAWNLTRDAAARIAALLLPRRRSCAPCCGDGDDGSDTMCACVAAERPCFADDCPAGCVARNPLNTLERSIPGYDLSRHLLSNCAADHLSVVRGLSAAQLAARYPLECGFGCRGAPAELAKTLTLSRAPCASCGRNGRLKYFSFCLNRVVNAHEVTHCLDCGRCYYLSPGFSSVCPYCAWRDPTDAAGDNNSDLDE